MKSESAALGSLAMRHAAKGARAVVGGVAGHSPLEWGAGDAGQRRGSRAGKVFFPPTKKNSLQSYLAIFHEFLLKLV